ncbi:MAG: PepSY domain-containing protein [Pseudomonadaceae bacterium]|jgi:uncharacterized iron-regulated membrane protein|nr:PepSY domain-containing protein [Pseudomonadaceae bacterium]
MRASLLVLHRWLGLFIAVFLLISGSTGALIAWDHELDEWLNPEIFQTSSLSSGQDALVLADQLEARDPRLQVTYLPLHTEPGRNLAVHVGPRPDASGVLPVIDFDQLALDPVSGAVLAQRLWGEVSLRRENIMGFLYKLHYSLHIPDGFGLPLGMLVLGAVSMVWVIDSAIALWIAFPARRSWRKSFAFRWRQGGYKLNFDLHRSGGVWLWPLILLMAVSSVAMNLQFEVMRPVVNWFSTLTPSPFERQPALALERAPAPQLDRNQALGLASREALRLGISEPPGGIFYSAEFGLYGVGFFVASAEHGDGGLGNPWLYVDAQSGALLPASLPGQGSAGDVFMQAQFPLHSGRIIGVPGRILVSLLGGLIAMLSLTGIVIWLRKRASRRVVRHRAAAQ